MTYCPDCGVEIGTAPNCPLCGAQNPKMTVTPECTEPDTASKLGLFGNVVSPESFTPQEKQKVAWEVMSVAFGITVGGLLAINFLLAGGISWSLYPIASLCFLWILGSTILVMSPHAWYRNLLLVVDLPLFLLALGAITGSSAWAIEMAIPNAIITELVTIAVLLSIRATKRKGLNIFALILFGVAVLCIGIEILIDLRATGKINLNWSAITAISLVPIAGFLLYLHFRVATTANLHRLFKL